MRRIIKAFLPPIIWDLLRIPARLARKLKDNKNSAAPFSAASDSVDSCAVTLRKKSFGELNPDKEFYVITGFGAGMFSTVQYVLAHIRQAELLGMTPVVDFANFRTAYTSSPINGEANTWNWFFEPVSPYTLEEVYKSKHVFFNSGEYNWDMGHYFSGHNFFDVYSKHIFLQAPIKRQIEEYKTASHFNDGGGTEY